MTATARASTAIDTVLLDIEGTTIPVSFVHETLFPYARAAMPALLAQRAGDPAVRAAVADIAELAPGVPPLAQLNEWMDQDAKIGPLKALQGLAWAEGYRSGALQAPLFADVLPALRRWRAAGLRLAVYSSGSEAAQRLIYGHTTEGDAAGLFDGFYDLRIGGKRAADSYRAILAETGWTPGRTLFLSDIVAELDAAAQAGLHTCQLVRAEDGTIAGTTHPAAATLDDVSRLFALPAV
ncbi:acireductone synthase [Gluconacetobacter azotocaptans]|uniref:Enolase-phosphatase E1 n=1 Tax=Gluconacetobacter azotocaptans TaxID=142834 RepID=A0A7W4PGD9_9PROT|nr:acireductone synthase [Gluconacetobacter azotocaptans]MBB2191504.1 acireductone synthase [Gluconacetobacter azotocaptans]GBQ32815.1 2,3-diketo-5-methylthio-1-phosphopentane phosphatase [Gluconacetobacter azotocaptans DSM 13594]